MSRLNLAIIDPDNPPSQREYNEEEQFALSRVRSFLFGGLEYATTKGRKWRNVEVDGLTWSAEAAGDFPVRMRYSGYWDPAYSRGFVEESQEVREGADAPQRITRFKDWRYNEALGQFAAHHVEFVGSEGTPRGRIEFLRAEPFTEAEFEALVALPSLGGEDPIRGPYEYGYVEDFRPSVPIATRYTAEGTQQSPVPGTGAARARLRNIGWIALPILVAALLGVRMMRTRQGAGA
jgi:hypothetical protein